MSEDLRETIEIGAPPQQVWELVMDPRRLGEWVTTHRGVEDVPEGPLAEGSRFGQRLSLSGMPFSVTWTVTKLDPPRSARWDGKGPARSRAAVSYSLGAAGAGTRFEYGNSFKLPGGPLGRMAARAVSAASARREARESLARLKALLEFDDA